MTDFRSRKVPSIGAQSLVSIGKPPEIKVSRLKKSQYFLHTLWCNSKSQVVFQDNCLASASSSLNLVFQV